MCCGNKYLVSKNLTKIIFNITGEPEINKMAEMEPLYNSIPLCTFFVYGQYLLRNIDE